MSNLWRASRVLMLVVTVLVVAACGPAAQPDTTQATAAPAAGTGATAAPAAGGAATTAPAAVAPPAAPGKYSSPPFWPIASRPASCRQLSSDFRKSPSSSARAF